MRWYHYLAYFWGGMFLINGIPHFVNGVSGNPFQTPFASPPAQGLSSSTVNALWGIFNFVVAYLLLARVGQFEWRKTRPVLIASLGGLVMSIWLARELGRLHGGLIGSF